MKEESKRRAQAKKIRSHRSRSKSEEIAKEDLGRGAKEKRSPFSREGRNASEARSRNPRLDYGTVQVARQQLQRPACQE